MTIGKKTAFRVRVGPRALRVLWPVMVLVLSSFSFAGAANEFLHPSNVSCACSNKVLTFQCTVDGGTATVWKGSTFSCDNNQITLLHSRFTDGTMGNCNDGAIIAESLNGENNRYTSQLRVNISSGLNNKTVMCIVNSETGMVIVGDTQLIVITDPTVQVPNGIRLTNVEQERLIFTWNAVNTNCPSINYLPSSNCTSWLCVNPTDTTTAVCSGLQLPSVCTFTIQTEVCGQVGSPSEPITVTLRVPDMPIVKIIPVYSGAQQGLLRIKANITDEQDSFNITDTVSGSVTSYSISYNSANTKTFGRNTSCVESTCAYHIDVPSDLCPSSNHISFALSASNRLGQGPPSDRTTIGCTNQFVQVEYDRTKSKITCRFLDESDRSLKSCNVTYGQCGQEFRQLGNFSTREAPNIVCISLPVDSGSLECYYVTASSDVFTVVIQALGSGREKGTDDVTVIVVTTVVLLFAIVVLVSVSVILVYIWILRRMKMSNALLKYDTQSGIIHNPEDIEHISMEDIGSDSKKVLDIDQLDLQKIQPWILAKSEQHEVSHDCELRDFVESELKLEFKRGFAFYEFVHDFEDISEDKVLIFKDKVISELYSPIVDTKSNPLIGRKIPKPNSDSVEVFVQSTGSGARHLPAGSRLFYKLSYQPSKQEPPLKLVISSHFKMKKLTKDVKLKEICKKSSYCIFLELGTFMKTSEVIDVIWQDKRAESQLYTGPSARKMVKDHYKEGGSGGFDQDKWRVFVLCKFDGNMDLKSGTNILQYEIPQISIDDFHVLTAGEDERCSPLSKFVEQKLKDVDGTVPEFINGHAFYEFEREEDLQYYKEVIFWETLTDKLTSGIDLFYGLSGAPAVGVRPTRKEGVRVFIQSTSQGARCVKSGDTILYKRKLTESEPTEHKEHIYKNTS